MERYVALVQRNGEGQYFLTVPDVPGFTFGGVNSIDAVLREAAKVFRDHIDILIEDGDPVPPAREIDELRVSHDLADDFALSEMVVSLPLLPTEGKAVRVNATLDKELLSEIDRAAERAGMTRSSFLAEGAKRLLAETA